ncbi:MAG: hypothetical protein Q8K15_02275 [Candidatus Omnitrophota bacterium]|nr:hypothetical protein [Candidatus Omnitrophota bacterium]
MKKFVIVFLSCVLLANLAGCESFARKFTRKSKKADQAVEMVLTPEEYKGPNMTKEEIYRQYFLFWKSWQDELINALVQRSSLKKKIDCAREALKNLVNMRGLLVAPSQKNLDVYIAKSRDLISDMQSDIYGSNDNRNIQTAERLKADIQRGFIYPKIRNYLL